MNISDSNISNQNFQTIKLNFDEFSKKGINIILNSRIKNFNANNIFSSSSTQNTSNDSLNFSLEDSFMEDCSFLNNSNYQDLFQRLLKNGHFLLIQQNLLNKVQIYHLNL